MIATATKLAQLWNEGKALSPKELKELKAKVEAFKEMACIEDRLRTLENRKRPRVDDPAIKEPVRPTRVSV